MKEFSLRSNGNKMKRGFTLIEVLIASSILIAVIAAVIALSNSINRNTIIASDMTDANNMVNTDFTTMKGDIQAEINSGGVWLPQAELEAGGASKYGWYYKDKVTGDLTKFSSPKTNVLTPDDIFVNNDPKNMETTNNVDYYHLLCFESFESKASSMSDDSKFYCNEDGGGNIYNDGTRAVNSDCETSGGKNDAYCVFSKPSLNTNSIDLWTQKYVPSGNAVKVRVLVVWKEKEEVLYSDMARLFTNQNSSTK